MFRPKIWALGLQVVTGAPPLLVPDRPAKRIRRVSLLTANTDTFTLRGLAYFPHVVDTVTFSMNIANMFHEGFRREERGHLNPELWTTGSHAR
ncbi:hypothetical protein N579_0113445 [Corynebacterium pseudodiphtheriticum 090104]|nr:hypothetical protein N579_0113445 [Corynebacterium pseudodiphtheriticum 090104]